MRSDQEIRDGLRRWVLAKAATLADTELTDRTALFEGRHLRSVHLPELLLYLEGLRGAPIEVDSLAPGDFRDIDSIVHRFGNAGAPS
jgi:hypothetical protein